ncbi:MAG TPA: hypothetical protein VGF67_27390 [Ktedonobacteraceae bacterium]|jgi:hypothetical protein
MSVSLLVLNHAEQYQKGVLWDIHDQAGTYRPEQNHYFLEFVRTEPLREDFCETQQLLWFGDRLRYDLFCCGPLSGSEGEVKHTQEYLWNWGYRPKERMIPLRTGIAGLLVWSITRYARFFVNAQRKPTFRSLEDLFSEYREKRKLLHEVPVFLVLTKMKRHVSRTYIPDICVFPTCISCKTDNTFIYSYAKKCFSRLRNVGQCGVWGSARTKSVRTVLEKRFRDSFQNHPDDLLHQLLIPRRHIHSTLPLLANRLRNG